MPEVNSLTFPLKHLILLRADLHQGQSQVWLQKEGAWSPWYQSWEAKEYSAWIFKVGIHFLLLTGIVVLSFQLLPALFAGITSPPHTIASYSIDYVESRKVNQVHTHHLWLQHCATSWLLVWEKFGNRLIRAWEQPHMWRSAQPKFRQSFACLDSLVVLGHTQIVSGA